MLFPPGASRPRPLHATLLVVALAAFLVCGCGQEAAVQAGSVTKTAKPSAVPAAATDYANIVDLTLKTTETQAAALLVRMRTDAPQSLGRLCSDAGLQYSYQYDAFRQTFTPGYVRPTASLAIKGYKLALSSMDECGNAADESDPKGMRIAANDFAKALSQIAYAEHSLSAIMSASH